MLAGSYAGEFQEVVISLAGIGIEVVKVPLPGGAVCLGDSDAKVAVVAVVVEGWIVSGNAHDIPASLFVVGGEGKEKNHTFAACAATTIPKVFKPGGAGETDAILIENLEAAVDADDDMITADHNGRVGRCALLGLGVVDGFEAADKVQVVVGYISGTGAVIDRASGFDRVVGIGF